MKQAPWLLISLIALIGSNWYYKLPNKHNTLDDASLSSTVDTTVYQLSVQQFNELGELANQLNTPLMEHIPKDNIHLIQTPHLLIKEKDQPAWEISSAKAKSVAGGSQITFIHNVVVHQQAGQTNQESTLKTEEVTYFPQEKKATTDLFVTYDQPGNRVQSTGMNAYLDEKRVELLHGARGSYVPKNQG
jgi:lipopolysaccharide export system protein LptC